MVNRIPVQNIYYLLCYAWNMLEEGDTIDVSTVGSPELADLFARVLASGTHHLIRRGFDRDYLSFSAETPRIRGRINFAQTLKRNLLERRRPLCEFDELTHDITHNQILKATITNLLTVEGLNLGLKDELWEVSRWLKDVGAIRLTSQVFRRVQLHRNNSYYRFLMNVCELVFENLLADETTGDTRFRDFTRDEHKMRALFEEFVRNFYRIRQSEFAVTTNRLLWAVQPDEPAVRAHIPEMLTDICLISASRQLIIDCKFSQRIFSNYYGKRSLNPNHLYQITTYLRTAKRQKGWNKVEGILLYPVVGDDVTLHFGLDGFPFQVRSINLDQPWPQIEKHLLRIISKTSI